MVNVQTTTLSFDTTDENDDEEKESEQFDLDVDEDLAFAAETIQPSDKKLEKGFNEYGVRENTDEEGNLTSVDAIYEAMEPGPPERRNSVRITKEFLKEVASKEYDDNPPHLLDHQKDTLSHIGFVRDVWFDETKEKLMLMTRTYNTGAETHNEVINRLTNEPPVIQDGSAGFGQQYETIENEDNEIELVDGKLKEFSTTPFPGGYDEGGIRTSWVEAAQDSASEIEEGN